MNKNETRRRHKAYMERHYAEMERLSAEFDETMALVRKMNQATCGLLAANAESIPDDDGVGPDAEIRRTLKRIPRYMVDKAGGTDPVT